ncbi:MAG: hypothetical protein LUD00_07075 [Prevotellaceae bacterium]|nr:hypothetical protein [Prevotellaceae bacterium]
MSKDYKETDDTLMDGAEDVSVESHAADSRELDSEKEAEVTDKAEAIEAIKKFTDEDDDFGDFSFKSIIGGDILQSRFFMRQILWFLLVAVLAVLYTGNRYSSEHDVIVIDSLKEQLQTVKYNVLTQSSELMNLSRQSNVERMLKHSKDSMLQNPVTPPYVILADSVE